MSQDLFCIEAPLDSKNVPCQEQLPVLFSYPLSELPSFPSQVETRNVCFTISFNDVFVNNHFTLQTV